MIKTWQRKSNWYLECQRTGRRISKAIAGDKTLYTLWDNGKPREVMKTSKNVNELKGYSLSV